MNTVERFIRAQGGAVTIDWIALSAGILLVGIAVVYSIFSSGVDGVIGNINTELSSVFE